LQEQFADAYHKAFFGDSVWKLFPGFKVSLLAGDQWHITCTCNFCALENDMKEPGKPVNLTFIPGSDHFVGILYVKFSSNNTDRYAVTAPLGRDDPEEALRVYLECS